MIGENLEIHMYEMDKIRVDKKNPSLSSDFYEVLTCTFLFYFLSISALNYQKQKPFISSNLTQKLPFCNKIWGVGQRYAEKRFERPYLPHHSLY